MRILRGLGIVSILLLPVAFMSLAGWFGGPTGPDSGIARSLVFVTVLGAAGICAAIACVGSFFVRPIDNTTMMLARGPLIVIAVGVVLLLAGGLLL